MPLQWVQLQGAAAGPVAPGPGHQGPGRWRVDALGQGSVAGLLRQGHVTHSERSSRSEVAAGTGWGVQHFPHNVGGSAGRSGRYI